MGARRRRGPWRPRGGGGRSAPGEEETVKTVSQWSGFGNKVMELLVETI